MNGAQKKKDAAYGSSSFSVFSTLVIMSFLLQPCWGYDVVSHGGFDLHFPDG